jgi:hypothetical protein
MSDRREFMKNSAAAVFAGVGAYATGKKVFAEKKEPEARVAKEVEVILDEELKAVLVEAYDFLDDIDLQYPEEEYIRCPYCEQTEDVHLTGISWRLDEKRTAIREKLRRFVVKV